MSKSVNLESQAGPCANCLVWDPIDENGFPAGMEINIFPWAQRGLDHTPHLVGSVTIRLVATISSL